MAKDKLICAIDVGSSKIATLIASLTEDDRINLIGVSASASKGVKKGQVVDIEEAVSAITESVEAAERMAGCSITNAYISVGGPQIDSTNSHAVVAVSKPESEIEESDILRVNDAARAINLPPSKEILHVVPRSFTVDGQDGIRDPIGMTGVRLETDTHIVTGSSTSMRNLVKCMGLVGVNVDELVFSGIASSLSCLSETEKELGVVLVDIGAETTDIVIYVDGSLSYSSVIPVGARHITSDLAVGLRVSLESAEKIKLYLGKPVKAPVLPDSYTKDDSTKNSASLGKIGSTNKSKEDLIDSKAIGIKEDIPSISRKSSVESIIRPRVREIFELVAKEIKKSGFGTQIPSGLVICGGGALTVGLLDQAKYMLGYPARIGRVDGMIGLIDEVDSPSFASSAGLIKYGIKSNPTPSQFNFSGIPQNFPIKGIIDKAMGLIKSFLP